jgi:DNA-binding NtrC family response regulator
VVVLSADANSWQVRRLMAMGAQDYLTKPVDIQRLLSEVARHLQARERPRQAV